ncbi:MAG: exopolysaccharide biosynthesis protein [Pararhodobacter sp.]
MPFTSSILGGVVCLLSFGMLARDGLFTLLGVLTIGGLGATVLTLVNGATA